MLSATSMTLAFCDAGLSISPATCAATNRLISASTPATIRSTSARSDLDVTWMEMSARPWFLDVQNQQQWRGGPCRSPQRDLSEHHEFRPVDTQVDDHVDLERDPDGERDHLADLPGDPWLHDPDLGGHLGDLARALAHRPHLERVSSDSADRSADAVFCHCGLEEPAPELFVGHVVIGVHRAVTVSRPLNEPV